jgi:hypothetical protein
MVISLYNCRKLFAVSIGTLLTLGYSVPIALAQYRAQDQCKDVIIHPILDTLTVKNNTLFWLSYLSQQNANLQQSNENDRSVMGEISGLKADISGSDKDFLREELSRRINLDVLYENYTYIALQTGQANIIAAWDDCMKNHGGGPTAYFTSVPDSPGLPQRVDFHIDYIKTNSFRQPDLEIAEPIDIPEEIAKPIQGQECLKKGYKLKWGSTCTVRFEMTSMWSADVVTVPITDGDYRIDLSAYLAPRVVPEIEILEWPTYKSVEKSPRQSRVTKINQMSFASSKDAKEGVDENQNCQPADEGWVFLEGKRYPLARFPDIFESDLVKVNITTDLAGTHLEWCVFDWRISADRKLICMGGQQDTGNDPDLERCIVSIRATMFKIGWKSASGAQLQ